jgi:hypothetical protein
MIEDIGLRLCECKGCRRPFMAHMPDDRIRAMRELAAEKDGASVVVVCPRCQTAHSLPESVG